VTTDVVAFVLLSFLISVSVCTPASHRTFSVLLIAKVPSASLILLLWLGSNFFSNASVAKTYASSPYLSLPRTIIWCTFNRLSWSAPHVLCAKHLIIFIFFSAPGLCVLNVFQPVHPGVNCKSKDAMLSNLFDFFSF
jgi:hypothetical protein